MGFWVKNKLLLLKLLFEIRGEKNGKKKVGRPTIELESSMGLKAH